MDERMRIGMNVIELVWSEMARKIVEKAIVVYQLTGEQGAALRKAFLSRNLVRFVAA
jgi:hypothetical protein